MAEHCENSNFIVNIEENKYKTCFYKPTYLGEGAYGEVFKVKRKADDKEFAIKIINLREKSSDLVKRELLIKEFDHPYIVKYFDSWLESIPTREEQDDGKFLYVLMELCEKDNLANWILNNGATIQKLEMVLIFEQIVSALECVHLKGYIHRDLKVRIIFFYM